MNAFFNPWMRPPKSGSELAPLDEETELARRQAMHADDEYTKRHRFYARPTRLLKWGGKQEPRHAAPHDVFVDLILVAACFQTGHFLSHNLDRPSLGILGLCAFGATSITLWSDLLAYRSRFETASVVHSLIDGAHALCFAAAAHNIVADVAQFEAGHLHGFVIFVLAARGCSLLRLLEVAALTESDPRDGNARAAATDMAARLLVEALALAPAFWLRRAAPTFALLISAAIAQFALSVLPMLAGYGKQESRVPVHLQFVIGRTSELVMLALGETVLSLVLIVGGGEADGDTQAGAAAGASYADDAAASSAQCPACPRAYHLMAAWRAERAPAGACEPCDVAPLRDVAFVAGFLLISSMVYLYHHANPTHRHRHVTRRSMARSIVWTFSSWTLVVAIIALAASIKELFRRAAQPVPREHARLLAGSLGTCVLVVNAQAILHPGLLPYLHAPVGRARRLGLGLARLLLLLPLVLVAEPELLGARAAGLLDVGYKLLVVSAALAFGAALLLAADKSDGASNKSLWLVADAVLGGEALDRAVARERDKMLAGLRAPADAEAAARANRKGLALTNPFALRADDDAGGGCVPCGRRSKAGSSSSYGTLTGRQWERLG